MDISGMAFRLSRKVENHTDTNLSNRRMEIRSQKRWAVPHALPQNTWQRISQPMATNNHCHRGKLRRSLITATALPSLHPMVINGGGARPCKTSGVQVTDTDVLPRLDRNLSIETMCLRNTGCPKRSNHGKDRAIKAWDVPPLQGQMSKPPRENLTAIVSLKRDLALRLQPNLD